MSQYRDDRDAACHRIEALEAKLAEREAELSAKGAELSRREVEVSRLRRELDLTGSPLRRGRPLQAAWAARMVAASVGVAAIAMGLGVWAIRAPRTVIVEVAPHGHAPPPAPIFADPAQVVADPRPEVEEQPPSAPSSSTEAALRRQLEEKVWAGHGSTEEIRMLKAICSHQGDRACRDRARALLDGKKPKVF
jgi:hypothetical protein